MYYNEIYTIIDVDERSRKMEFYNYKNDHIYILKELDLPFHNPLLIIEKTKGRMAEDNFSICIERKK